MASTNSIDPPVHSAVTAESGRLDGNMGVLQLVATVLAYNGPAVVFLGFIPVAIALGNGLGIPVTILACGAVVLCLAVGLVAMARKLPTPGGFYAFITAGLGKAVGLSSGFVAIMSYYVACLSVYALGGIAMRALMANVLHGPSLPWWVWAAALFVIVAVLGYLRIDLSAKVLVVFLGVELLFLVAYDVVVIAQGGANGLGLESFEPSSIFSGSIGIGFMFALGLFGGFEATVIFRDEVKDPSRTIPRATYAVIALLGGLYCLTSWVFINSYGAAAILEAVNTDPTGAATESVRQYIGPIGYDIATILLLTSSFALILASHNITTRYMFNLSADHILHHSLSRVHEKHLSPHRASIAMSIASLVGIAIVVLANIDETVIYGRVAGVFAYTFLILLLMVAVAIVVYLARHREPGDSIFTIIAPAVAAVMVAVGLYLATENFTLITGAEGLTSTVMLIVIYGVMVAGVVMALVYRSRRPDVYARIGREDVDTRADVAVD